MASVLSCSDWNVASSSCNQFQLIEEVHLIPLSQAELIELMSTGGFSVEAFGLAFTGTLGVWAVGLAVGIIIAQIRKLKP